MLFVIRRINTQNIMEFHGDDVFCACGNIITSVDSLEPHDDCQKYVKLCKYSILLGLCFPTPDGEFMCYCGRRIGHREPGSEYMLLIPIKAIKQVGSSVYIVDIDDSESDSESN